MGARLVTEERPLRVAIVGSGPSGFYAAQALLRSDVNTVVDMFDRLLRIISAEQLINAINM